MASIDLRDAVALKTLCEQVERSVVGNTGVQKWREELVTFLDWIHHTPPEGRAERTFQKRLWDDNPIASVGMGTVNVEPVLDDAAFRRWIADLAAEQMPPVLAALVARLNEIHNTLLERLRSHLPRLPRLKTFRLMAALFPRNFTTLSDRGRLSELYDLMFEPAKTTSVDQHLRIRARFDELLGSCGDTTKSIVQRMTLPWLVLRAAKETDVESTTKLEPAGASRLEPLPAARRRRGLTAVRGYFQTMLNVLEAVDHGVTREELIDHLRTLLTDYKDSSLGIAINVLLGEFGVIERKDDNRYHLTPRGEAVLDTGEPDELADWLLTRVLGVDHALVYLQKHDATTRDKLFEAIQGANPGWTTTFSCSSEVSWLRDLGVIEIDNTGTIRLTERGQAWAGQIHWEPQALVLSDTVTSTEIGSKPGAPPTIARPPFEEINRRLAIAAEFPPAVIADLHAGLWAHPRRHFAVLTGLSGAGKTKLARDYGRALINDEVAEKQQLRTIAIQPGWYDPAPLLGYVNPIRPDSYVRAPFLELLLRASDNPGRPYVVVLDEMNLSRPEQYFANLLSTMETGDAIDLHQEQDGFDGMPRSVGYPSNLVIIGTVNMDETTHGLSDKVLDRAFTVEFWDIDIQRFKRWGTTALGAEREKTVRELLMRLMEALRPARLHFGWRVIDEVLSFLEQRCTLGDAITFEDAIDSVLYAKVIPKLRGDESVRFKNALTAVEKIANDEKLPRCRAKVRELLEDLQLTGSARFWR
jgi:5-methylcytosine-specific restriction enzyme B